jgi:hypothetical protein
MLDNGYWFFKFEVTSLECLKLKDEKLRFELPTPHSTFRCWMLDDWMTGWVDDWMAGMDASDHISSLRLAPCALRLTPCALRLIYGPE